MKKIKLFNIMSSLLHRHCERSEAIQIERQFTGLLRVNPRNDVFRSFLLLPVAAALIILAASCGQSAQKKTAAEQPESLEISEESQNSGYLKIVGDSVEIPYFEIELKLSEKAEEKLKTVDESVVVFAYFSGKAKENIPDKYADLVDYGFNFLTHQIELTDERVARFEHIKFSKELYDLLEDKDINLLINVVSGGRFSEFNMLDCDILENSISNVTGKRFTLNGKLVDNDN